MSGIKCFGMTGEVALSAGVAKTVMQVNAQSSTPIKVHEWAVFFDGTSNSAEPVVVELLRQTTAGTMSALTLVKRSTGSEAISSGGQHTATVEPTAGDVVDGAEVHPQGGYEKQFPLGREIDVAGSGRIGIRVTAPAAVNCKAKIAFEE